MVPNDRIRFGVIRVKTVLNKEAFVIARCIISGRIAGII